MAMYAFQVCCVYMVVCWSMSMSLQAALITRYPVFLSLCLLFSVLLHFSSCVRVLVSTCVWPPCTCDLFLSS